MSNVGFFDLPSAFLSGIDLGLAALLPPLARLLLWTMFGAMVSMACYRLLSSQSKLAETKHTIARTRKQLLSYDGELAGSLLLTRQLLRLSFTQIRLAGVPTLCASLPLIFLVVWIANTYAYEKPLPGKILEFTLEPEQTQVTWNTSARLDKGGAWLASWPVGGQGLQLFDQYGQQVVIDGAAPVLHKRVWWNSLVANPSGYIPQQSPLERIEIGLQKRQYLAVGPAWLRGWEAVFVSVLLLVSLLIKVIFKIH